MRKTLSMIPLLFFILMSTSLYAQDQCDFTYQCKEIYGDRATDCANSQSNNSVCMCGSQRCDDSGPGSPDILGRFDKTKDMLLANFDSKPDVDDIHSVAALGTMLLDSRFSDVKYHAVAGAVGRQNGVFIDAPNLFNMAFGNNWSSAASNWDNAVNTVSGKVIAALNNGGDIWVQEAGQSDFTADVVRKVKNLLPGINTKTRIHVVQHSNWNQDQTTPADLNYTRQNTDYIKIPDGNGSNNGTPDYNTSNGSNWGRATSDAQAGRLWVEARRVANAYNGTTGYNNPSIANGGFDFSDVVEDTWIFGFNWINGVSGFFDEFL